MTVNYGGGNGVLAGAWTETYSDYSDNGGTSSAGRSAITETGRVGHLHVAPDDDRCRHRRHDVEFSSDGRGPRHLDL